MIKTYIKHIQKSLDKYWNQYEKSMQHIEITKETKLVDIMDVLTRAGKLKIRKWIKKDLRLDQFVIDPNKTVNKLVLEYAYWLTHNDYHYNPIPTWNSLEDNSINWDAIDEAENEVLNELSRLYNTYHITPPNMPMFEEVNYGLNILEDCIINIK